MWQYYFGPQARIIGIDIEPDCRIYDEMVSLYISVINRVKHSGVCFVTSEPNIDIVIDDGSHKHKHQAITFEALFPHIQRVVYISVKIYMGIQQVISRNTWQRFSHTITRSYWIRKE